MRNKTLNKLAVFGLSTFLATSVFFQTTLTAFAETDYAAEAEARKSLPIQSNEIENWPAGPAIGAASAILIEANTGTILYSKNIDEQHFPASTTKIMTSLLAMENIPSLSEMVPFSSEAVYSIESGSSNAGIDVGQELTFEECLYIMLLYSANEVCNAVAEKVSGSIPEFVNLMNQRAVELGCKNTHFNNTNGLPDDQHYTTAYDLAMIAKEFFKNETLCKVSGTKSYTIVPSAKQPDTWDMCNHHKMCQGLEYSYDYFIGGKTGYTNVARQTLVSCAEKDGMKLICVIMKEESPNQFLDTTELFNYGFDNFQNVNVADNETSYVVENTDFFNTNCDVFGSSKPIMSISSDYFITLPKTAEFADTTSELSYDANDNVSIATIHYNYNGAAVGDAMVALAAEDQTTYDFNSPAVDSDKTQDVPAKKNVIFINILKVFGIIVGIAALLIGFIVLRAVIKNYHFSKRRTYQNRRRRKRRKKQKFDYFDI